MSNHSVEVVPVELIKHSNADKLSIINIFDGYKYVAATEEWKGVTKAVYIPPDSLVDTRRPEFEFFAKDAKYDENSNNVKGPYYRIRAKKIRGVVSYGFMVPVDDYRTVGEDMTNILGIKHYEPPLNNPGKQKNHFLTGGEVEAGPNLYHVKYDIDNFQRYAKKVFIPGELITVAEKIHGASGKWVYHNDRFYCGSRTEWKREFARISVPDRSKLIEDIVRKGNGIPEKFSTIEEYADHILASIKNKNENPLQNMWWRALKTHPELMEWLKCNPDIIVYGEVYGSVQNLRYGIKPGQVRIGVFDLMRKSQWVDVEEARIISENLPWVPLVAHNIPFDFDKLIEMSDGPSLIEGAAHYREGIVVKTLKERTDPIIGRVQLKIISPTYLEKS